MDIENGECPINSELVLDLVMPYLPIKYCVRMSVLSSRWRYRWTTTPSLVFDTSCCPGRYTVQEESEALVKVVNHVLLHHNGSVQVFEFSSFRFASDIDWWILRLSKASIKTLVLDLWSTDRYKLPSSLFNCGSLSRLWLKNCLLIPPPSSFKGFNNLKCLELVRVALANDALEKLISSCPLLEKLLLWELEQSNGVRYRLPSSLFICSGLCSLSVIRCLLSLPSSFEGFKHLKFLELNHVTLTNDALDRLISSCPLLEELELFMVNKANNLKINAPNLKRANIYGDFVNITFGYAMTRLSRVCIKALECAYASLLDFLIKLPSIQFLELKWCIKGHISGNSIVEGFPFECKDLYHLAINMDFSITGDDEPSLYLYRSSSSSTELDKGDWDECYLAVELGEWQDNSKRHNQFEKLRSVNVSNYLGTQEELKLVKFVLGKSPVLEKMTVNPDSDDIIWESVKSICEFKRASSEVKIMIDGDAFFS